MEKTLKVSKKLVICLLMGLIFLLVMALGVAVLFSPLILFELGLIGAKATIASQILTVALLFGLMFYDEI